MMHLFSFMSQLPGLAHCRQSWPHDPSADVVKHVVRLQHICCRPVRTAPEMAAASEEHTERLSPSSTANAVVMGRRDNAIVTGQAFCLSALTSI